MKYLKLFENHQTEAEVAKICKEWGIENWSLNSDGLVDVDNNVDFANRIHFRKKLYKLPLKFGTVNGNFACDNNLLNTLEGAPHTVGGYFNCSRNKLKNLEGAPHTVGLGKRYGAFDYFICDQNELTSLKGAPHRIGGDFNCNTNQLTSLDFTTKSVGGNFNCQGNNIRSFEGLVNIGGNFHCSRNPVKEIWRIINPDNNKWNNDKMDFFNDLDIIRGEEIAIERLNFFLEEIGLDPVESVKGYKNIY